MLAQRSLDDGVGQVPDDEAVARVVPGRVRAARRRDGADGRRAHHDDAPDARGPHGLGDDLGAAGGDTGVGLGPRTERGQHRVGAGDRGLDRGRVSGGEVGGHGAGRCRRELLRVPCHGGHIVTGGDGLLEQLSADTAGRRDDGEFHQMPPSPRAARLGGRAAHQDDGNRRRNVTPGAAWSGLGRYQGWPGPRASGPRTARSALRTSGSGTPNLAAASAKVGRPPARLATRRFTVAASG